MCSRLDGNAGYFLVAPILFDRATAATPGEVMQIHSVTQWGGVAGPVQAESTIRFLRRPESRSPNPH
jgi:hypothetical protein